MNDKLSFRHNIVKLLVCTIAIGIYLVVCLVGGYCTTYASSDYTKSIETIISQNNDIVFKRGRIKYIYYDENIACWKAEVYFEEIDETSYVILPDSVLDDIYIGWNGYFSFRKGFDNPNWVGRDFNVNVHGK